MNIKKQEEVKHITVDCVKEVDCENNTYTLIILDLEVSTDADNREVPCNFTTETCSTKDVAIMDAVSQIELILKDIGMTVTSETMWEWEGLED